MWPPITLLLLQSVPSLTESVESVKQIGYAQTISLILILVGLLWLSVVGLAIKQAMSSMIKDSGNNATAQALSVEAQRRIESQNAQGLEMMRRVEALCQRLIDRAH